MIGFFEEALASNATKRFQHHRLCGTQMCQNHHEPSSQLSSYTTREAVELHHKFAHVEQRAVEIVLSLKAEEGRV